MPRDATVLIPPLMKSATLYQKFIAHTKITFFKSFILCGVMSPRSMRDEALRSVLDESDGIVVVDVRRDAGNTAEFEVGVRVSEKTNVGKLNAICNAKWQSQTSNNARISSLRRMRR